MDPKQTYLQFKPNAQNATDAFDRLLKIIKLLRAYCPWDKKQTIESLRYLTIEETFELSDAIMSQDSEEIKKELGDLLLHIVFYSEIGSEHHEFNITDVCNGICEKLIRRHPHIFSDTSVKNEEDVKQNWEKIKLQEKGSHGNKRSVLEGVPRSLPAMIKASRIQEKARGVGFDWDNTKQVWDKVCEEINELKEELAKSDEQKNKKNIESEFGDILFALINYARFIDVNPEDALEKTNRKFISRFNYLEQQTIAQGKDLHSMSLNEMEAIWQESKKQEIKSTN